MNINEMKLAKAAINKMLESPNRLSDEEYKALIIASLCIEKIRAVKEIVS